MFPPTLFDDFHPRPSLFFVLPSIPHGSSQIQIHLQIVLFALANNPTNDIQTMNVTSGMTTLSNINFSQGYNQVTTALLFFLMSLWTTLYAFGQVILGCCLSLYLTGQSFYYPTALPFYHHSAVPYYHNNLVPNFNYFLYELLRLLLFVLNYATHIISGAISNVATRKMTKAVIDYCDPMTFFYSVLFASSLIVLIEPSIRRACVRSYQAFQRRVHHLSVVLFPWIFARNPRYGARTLPDYLFTDGLTPEDVQVEPFKGEHTAEQLTRHTVDRTNTQVNLIVNAAEATQGFHPGTAIRVSVPARPTVVAGLTRNLQEAVDRGTSEASSTRNFVQAVHHNLTHVTNPTLVPLQPAPGAPFHSVVLGHPQCKELAVAATDVLSRRGTKRKLGAFIGAARDQHVKIAKYDHNGQSNRHRRLNKEHGRALIDPHWPLVPH